jgi:hypothetical protein
LACLILAGYNTKVNVDGIAGESSRPGPTISSVIDNRVVDPSQNPLTGYIVEDGCIPEPFNPFIQIMLIMQTMRAHAPSLLWDFQLRFWKILASLKSLILGPYTHGGAIQRTSTYLVMSHDSNEITVTLKKDRLLLRGPAEGRSDNFARLKGIVNRAIMHSGAKMGYSYFYGSTSFSGDSWSKLSLVL